MGDSTLGWVREAHELRQTKAELKRARLYALLVTIIAVIEALYIIL